MDLQDLGNIGELVAAIATLATLAYLALQIRQNTQAIRGSTVHLVTQTQQQELRWSGEIAEAYTKAIETPGELNTTETWQMDSWLLLSADEQMLQIEAGIVLDKAVHR